MSKQNIQEMLTDKILEAMEKGCAPWSQPWKDGLGSFPRNYITGKPYRGINVWILLLEERDSPYWLTYNQAKAKGGNVRKGEKGTQIAFWKILNVKDKDDPEKTQTIPMLRYYTVFNLSQCDGLEAPNESKFSPIEEAEKIVASYPEPRPLIELGCSKATYTASRDLVRMPSPKSFNDPEGFYSALFHEFSHSTGHESRLNRKSLLSSHGFGTDEYAKEELVAEISAGLLCLETGISPKTQDNSIAYLRSWADKIRADRRLLISATGQAQKSVDWIKGTKQRAES